MERLTMPRNTDGTVSQPTGMDWYSVLDKLTSYEDAEEQGRLVVLPCIRAFDNGEYGMAYEVLEWEERHGFMTQSYPTYEAAEAKLKEMEGKV